VALDAIADGKWDAAFSALGNPPRGFDFRDSPFGADAFDYFPLATGKTCSDIFTGFVFFAAPPDHRLSSGVPGLLGDGFREELLRRCRITGMDVSSKEFLAAMDRLDSVTVSGYGEEDTFDRGRYREKVERWLKRPAPVPAIDPPAKFEGKARM
jgi:hypothetical protein